MRMACFLLASFLLCVPGFAQKPLVYATDRDRERFDDYVNYITAEKLLPEDVIMATASYFLNVPYVGATLEMEPEGLVVNLHEMDCTTFVETVFALSKTVLDGKCTFEAFCENLQQFRYRNDVISNYSDRLHYTTDWIYENERKGLVEDITQKIGGEPLDGSVSFMSRNAEKYKQLKGNDELTAEIAAIERAITIRTRSYIPEDRIKDCSEFIKTGDMVCFVTSIDGLDVSHVGIACRKSGKLTFMHASSSQKQVIIEPRTLQEYTQAISKNTGVIIVRPKFSKQD